MAVSLYEIVLEGLDGGCGGGVGVGPGEALGGEIAAVTDVAQRLGDGGEIGVAVARRAAVL